MGKIIKILKKMGALVVKFAKICAICGQNALTRYSQRRYLLSGLAIQREK
jgi:hypothetical protein